MYKTASSHTGMIRDAYADVQRGTYSAQYVVILFLLRKDNQGNKRLFRFLHGFRKECTGRDFLREKEAGGKYLYGVLCNRAWDALAEFGSPEVEEHWLDTGTSTSDGGEIRIVA